MSPRQPRHAPSTFDPMGRTREQLLQALDSGEQGLSQADAPGRQQQYGLNQISFHRSRSPWWMLLQEFTALFPLLLLGAAGLSFLTDYLSPGEYYNLIGAARLLVVLLNAGVSFLQNYKVEKLMLSFLDYIPREVALLRDGKQQLAEHPLVGVLSLTIITPLYLLPQKSRSVSAV